MFIYHSIHLCILCNFISDYSECDCEKEYGLDIVCRKR